MKTVLAVLACFLIAAGGLVYKVHAMGGLAGVFATLATGVDLSGAGGAGPSDEDVAVFETWVAANGGTTPGGGTAGGTVGSQVYYQYSDEQGDVHFVQSLDAVPAHLRERAGRIELAARPRRQPGPDRAGGARKPFATAPEPGVVVYTAPWCGWCRKTLAHLDGKGVRYENRDIEANPAHRRELQSKTGSSSIPVTEIDGELVRGFDPRRIDALLGAG